MINLLDACTKFLCILFLLGALYGVFGSNVLPDGEGFSMLALVLSSYGGGALVHFLRLPPLVGMLTAGILFRNIPLPFDTYIPKDVASALRSVSLVIILLKAGLGLDPEKLKMLKWVIIRLSFVPCLFEVVATAVLSHFLLGLPWIWASMLGFILTAVSAAVLVPGALFLEETQLGTRRGIPTLIMASVSLDNVASLTGFFMLFNILTSNGNSSSWTLLLRFVEPFIGLALGSALGVILWYFPAKRSNAYIITYYQTSLLCLAGLMFVFLSKRFGISGVGAMGCVSLAFVASLAWRKDPEQFGRITWVTGLLWQLIEPFLFGLIGAEVTVENLKNNLGYSILALLCGTFVRILSVVLALLGSPLDVREKLFVALSWISKATVQAAVGSEALEYGKTQNKGYEFQEFGEKVLTMSVLVIMITAPLGAALMNLLAHRLLRRNEELVKVTTENSNLPDTSCSDTVANYGACSQNKIAT